MATEIWKVLQMQRIYIHERNFEDLEIKNFAE